VKRLSDQTLYEIIEVSVDAPPEEIERACDRAAATYGPGSLVTYTLASPEESALLGRRIEEARAVLLDPSARTRYDERIGVRAPSSPPPEPAMDRPPAPSPSAPAPLATWPPPPGEPVAAAPRPISPGLPAASPPLVGPPPAATVVEPPRDLSPVAEAAHGVAGPSPGPASPEPAPAISTPAEPLPPAPTPPSAPMAPAPIVLSKPVVPILLEREVPAPPEPPVAEGGEWTGEMLRRVRESRGLTVQQVAERTRITRHHLENIEQDRFPALPAPVYLRGIIMSLARELRLDGQKVARSYLDRMGLRAQGDARR
jgi:hypothetical protein